jgi:uncharacterized protein YjbI with pentapeptide repeats
MLKSEIGEILDKHPKWLNVEIGGERADLRYADLRDANLRDANLHGADLDFSCLPLWCGSLGVIVDRRIAAQIAYHFCSLVCDDDEVVHIQKLLYDFANTFHRVGEIPRLEGD